MRELPSIDELFDLLDVLRENGYEGTYEEMKYKLINDPASLLSLTNLSSQEEVLLIHY